MQLEKLIRRFCVTTRDGGTLQSVNVRDYERAGRTLDQQEEHAKRDADLALARWRTNYEGIGKFEPLSVVAHFR